MPTKNIKTCEVCESEFDVNSPEKKRAGGKITHCPDCADETAVKYLGLTSGDGKGVGVSILAFESDEARKQYSEYWYRNSGMDRGKSCQLALTRPTKPATPFRTVGSQGLGMNHKGKA